MSDALNQLASSHLERMRVFFDAAPEPSHAAQVYRDLLARCFNAMIPENASVLEIGCGGGDLLARLKARRVTGVDLSPAQIERARKRLPGGVFHVQAGERLDLEGPFDVIIASDTLNYAADVQLLLSRLRAVATPETRLIVNFQSNLWRPALALGRFVGVSGRTPESSWLSASDVRNLLALSDWEELRHDHRLLLPLPLLGAEGFANRWTAPLLPWLCLTDFVVARPRSGRPLRSAPQPSVSVVIPARNEAGNIEEAVRRVPAMGAWTELVFVEGHSTDDTWGEICRVQAAHPDKRIRALRQQGRGKGDAVRAGFAAATGDILMILDADLTMPPEELPKFFEVVASGRAELANGVRLVYPMEDRAMRFLNLCANKVFGLLFTWLLGQSLKDTLCGTKALCRRHYELIAANRGYFGDFDPFGDFDLLFGAGRLNLKIADVPIRYRERVYGQTNILRWRHGWLLLRMVLFAARKIKFV